MPPSELKKDKVILEDGVALPNKDGNRAAPIAPEAVTIVPSEASQPKVAEAKQVVKEAKESKPDATPAIEQQPAKVEPPPPAQPEFHAAPPS